MKKAIAVLCYDRPDYLEKVLISIKLQKIDNIDFQSEYDVYIFQDGLNEMALANHAKHENCAKIIEEQFPNCSFTKHNVNLGIANSFNFVERKLFLDLNYDFVIFFEDDMVLQKNYIEIVNFLAISHESDDRISMIAAYGNFSDIDIDDDEYGQLIGMSYSWGFGLFKRAWEKRAFFLKEYYRILDLNEYNKRDHNAIKFWLKSNGFKDDATSQDYVKQCIDTKNNLIRITTKANLAKYIGISGVHFDEVQYLSGGFDKTKLARAICFQPDKITESTYINLLTKQRVERLDNTPHKQLNVHPIKINIPDMPHMENEGIEVFKKEIASCRVYLEYGMGGTTVLAEKNLNLDCIISVDSDKNYVEALRQKLSTSNVSTHLSYVDIGQTKEWGQPIDNDGFRNYHEYYLRPWKIAMEHSLCPDLILIDGRFRVASFLSTLIYAKEDARILFDDYLDRPFYHVVEKFCEPKEFFGRLALFLVPKSLDYKEIIPVLAKYGSEWA